LYRLYGTYLIHLISEALKPSEWATVKEIAEKIHLYPNRREQENLENRIRRCLKTMVQEDLVLRESKTDEVSNLIIYQYSIKAIPANER